MARPKRMPKYMKLFDDLLEDHPTADLPPELQVCGTCDHPTDRCHLLVAGKLGRKKGVSAVCIRRCDGCRSLHLTQMFTDGARNTGVSTRLIQEIARDIGVGMPCSIDVVGDARAGSVPAANPTRH